MNLCLVTLDTTRADHLGCYGYKKAFTPNIDAVAGSGFLFLNAMTSSPLTAPAHASLMTGVFPAVHGVRENVKRTVSPDCPMLAEILKRRGYATCGVIGAFILSRQFGFGRGFDFFDDRFPGAERRADAVSAAGFEFLEKARKSGTPFFLWLHFFDPHASYDPLPEFRAQFPASPYDGEIAAVDREVGRLVYRLKKLGLFENTIMVLVGDHGEGLGEHSEPEHGSELYETTVRVPLIVSVPGQREEKKFKEQVRLVDLMPTILELLGAGPASDIQGKSFAGVFQGRDFKPGGSYMEAYRDTSLQGGKPLFGLRDAGYKYIDKESPLLFLLTNDPGEMTNLAGKEPAVAKAMRKKIVRIMAQSKAGRRRPGVEVPLKEDEIQKLKSLGYLR